MKAERFDQQSSRMSSALAELQGMIAERYPSALFDVSEGEDPEGIYLVATVDVEDTDEVAAVYSDRLLDMQVGERIPVYVLPIRPVARVARELRDRQREAGTRLIS